MTNKLISEEDLISDFRKMGVSSGDTILIRGSLGAVGKIEGGGRTFLSALLKVVGDDGTIVSLAFTDSSFIKKPKLEDAFHLGKPSNAGALPNIMINWLGAYRSRHPMCSYVAIGKNAERITANHNEFSGAYEPIRELIKLGGKCFVFGCVDTSPGFTTTHLAEADLGILSRVVFPWLMSTYYNDSQGKIKLYRRRDAGMCSNSFYKFYALYVREKILTTGFVGKAYSIVGPAKECYEIDKKALKKNKQLNVCESSSCFRCNVGRWDRIHHAPAYFARAVMKRVRRVVGS